MRAANTMTSVPVTEQIECWRRELPDRLQTLRLLLEISRAPVAQEQPELALSIRRFQRRLQLLARECTAPPAGITAGQCLDRLGEGVAALQDRFLALRADWQVGPLEPDPKLDLVGHELEMLLREGVTLWRGLLDFVRGAS
jgi:hypothetical protein